MPASSMLTASVAVLVAAFALGAVDGVHFHLRRFELFGHAASRGEHWLHTCRAILVLPALSLLYLIEPGGPLLWLAAAVVAADVAALLLDLRAEQRSRIHLGGMPHAEYVIHVVANGLHVAALALAFAARPAGAWSPGGVTAFHSPLPLAAQLVVLALLAAAVVASIQHVVLGLRGAARDSESKLRDRGGLHERCDRA